MSDPLNPAEVPDPQTNATDPTTDTNNIDPNAVAQNLDTTESTTPVATTPTVDAPTYFTNGSVVYEGDGNTYVETPDGSVSVTSGSYSELIIAIANLFPNKF